MNTIKQHFYGATAIGIGAWELAATTGRVPTVTRTLRRHRRLRVVWMLWLAGAAHHLWGEAT